MLGLCAGRWIGGERREAGWPASRGWSSRPGCWPRAGERGPGSGPAPAPVRSAGPSGPGCYLPSTGYSSP